MYFTSFTTTLFDVASKEENRPGPSVSDQEHEGMVGDELRAHGTRRRFPEYDSSSGGRFCPCLVDTDERLVEYISHKQWTLGADAGKICALAEH